MIETITILFLNFIINGWWKLCADRYIEIQVARGYSLVLIENFLDIFYFLIQILIIIVVYFLGYLIKHFIFK